LVSTGREELVETTPTGFDAGGKFVGWLDVVFTTRSRDCADAVTVIPAHAHKTQTERRKLFLKNFKTKNSSDGLVGTVEENLR